MEDMLGTKLKLLTRSGCKNNNRFIIQIFMKKYQFGLEKEIRPNYAESMNSNSIEPQLVRIQNVEQERPWREAPQPVVLRGGEEIQPGTLHGGEEIKPGTLCGGEEIQPGTLHGGEEIQPGTLHGGEEIQPGTLHSRNESLIVGTLCANYSPATYRTRDARALFTFRYVDIGGKFEIDIISQPLYGSRDSSLHATHRLSSSRGGYKICISTGHEPRTLDKAKKISMEWAELTHNYINTGRTIDAQVAANAGSGK
ncbi:hypothetical protein FACS1894203_5510 [Bacteroidia bacterium]|nr:hypothetical protein FACS1894203_5510 [Bacteroidia bacterium]